MKHLYAGLLLLLFSACGGVPDITPVEGQTKSPSKSQSGSLVLQLVAPAQVAAGKPVPLRLTLTNTGKEPAEAILGGRPPFDFIVTQDGREVWRWAEGQAIQMILETRTLGPGEKLEYSAEWPSTGAPPSPGRYLARGVLNMDPPEKLETSPQEIVVTPR